MGESMGEIALTVYLINNTIEIIEELYGPGVKK